jgi:SOS-response transcriptional repressor LexA
MVKKPSKKQRQLLDFIDNFIKAHGFAPSYREIMRSLDYASVSTVATHIENLVLLGYLQKTDHSARSLEVVQHKSDDYDNSVSVTPSQEKWLIDIINVRFRTIENTLPSQKEIDDLFVLVGALHVLGFQDAAIPFKTKLSSITE